MHTPTPFKLYFILPFSYHNEEHITWKGCHKTMFQILQGAQSGFVEVRGLTVKMNVLSIFTMGPSLLGGSGGMLPQEILKIRYPRLAKIGFST